MARAQSASEFLVLAAMVLIIALVVVNIMSDASRNPAASEDFARTMNEVGITGLIVSPAGARLSIANNLDSPIRIDAIWLNGSWSTTGAPSVVPAYGREQIQVYDLAVLPGTPYETDAVINFTILHSGERWALNWSEIEGESIELSSYAFDRYEPIVGDLLALWRFEEVSYTPAADEVEDWTTRDYDGTPYNDVETVTDGVFGRGALFDGSDDRIDIATTGEFPISNVSGTVMAWFNSIETYTGGDAYHYIFASRTGDAAVTRVYLLLGGNAGEANDFICGFGNDYQAIYNNNNVRGDMQWHHGALTWNSTVARCYLDGEPIGSYTHTIPESLNGIMRIGAYAQATPGEFFNGTIDEVAFWNRTLSGAEIHTIYLRGVVALS